jgi:hypothetical protein
LAATATRNLPPDLAGAGSGVYNATRQVGSVLGSASMAAFMTWRIGDELPLQLQGAAPHGEGAVTQLPTFLHEPFSDAMSQSTLLPAFVALFGVVAALFLVGARPAPALRSGAAQLGEAHDGEVDDFEPRTDEIPAIHEEYLIDEYGALFDDEDDYAEYALAPPEHLADAMPWPPPDDTDTEPLGLRADPGQVELVQLQPKEPYEPLYHDPPDSWMHLSDQQIGFAHNGSHIDGGQLFRDVSSEPPSPGRHARSEPDDGSMDPDADSYGRHSMPAGD